MTTPVAVLLVVLVTLAVALHLAAIIDVALMPGWAWRSAADAPKRRWIVLLALVPGWAIVYYRSADRREVRAHLFRCGGVEPEWQEGYEDGTHEPTRREHAVATVRQRRLLRSVVGQEMVHVPATPALDGGGLPPIHWRAPAEPPALERGHQPVALHAAASDLPPIRWHADEWMPRALPAPKPVLRLTA